MKKRQGFTLVELLAVLTILAIIALITVPLVLNVIDSSKEQSEKQSVIGYAKAVKIGIANWKVENPGKKYSDYDFSNVDYEGNDINCESKEIDETGELTLKLCYVVSNKREEERKYYNYIDGKVVEEKNPYVVAKEKEKNPLYKTFKVGDIIKVAGDRYYVISESKEGQEYVTVIKETPLTLNELKNLNSQYTKQCFEYVGCSNNLNDFGNETTDGGRPGNISFYMNSDCQATRWWGNTTGCSTNYHNSDIEHVINEWISSKSLNEKLAVDQQGYKARLITLDELQFLGYGEVQENGWSVNKGSDVPNWLYSDNYSYWTMSPQLINDYNANVYAVKSENISTNSVYNTSAVRPVINVYRSYIQIES